MKQPSFFFSTFVAVMIGLCYILVFWLIGNAISYCIGGYISGNIIGMVLFFTALRMGWVQAERVRGAARFLLGSMALFFVPFGVGLMVSYESIVANLWAILVASLVSTVVVLVIVGRLFQWLNARKTNENVISKEERL